ncbi:MAG: 5'/3'-nucleotidase SurE [Acidimicrobiia bacterium]
MTDTEHIADVSPGELSTRTAPAGRRPGGPEPALRCLVTNDDGIASPGIALLARVALDAGLDVVVAAPLRDTSGAGASITAVEEDGRFIVQRCPLPGLAGCDTYGVGGLPAFIALTGCRGAFGPIPDIVLSGINHGPNTGFAVLHSGTVGAALTASTHGARAMAVSLHSGAHIRIPHHAGTPHWETAAEVARQVLPRLLEAPPRTVLNVNVPNVPWAEVRGLHPARLAAFGAVQFNVVEKGEGYAKIGLSEMDAELEPGTDAALVAEGWATVTALRAVCQVDDLDLEVPPTPTGSSNSAGTTDSAGPTDRAGRQRGPSG